MEIWELSAREQIRDTLARYNWSGDSGRLEGLAETFCTDGVLKIRGGAELHGRSEIVAFLGGVSGKISSMGDVKPVVRHNLANVLFTAVTPDRRSCRVTSRWSPTSGSIISAATATPWCPSATPG